MTALNSKLVGGFTKIRNALNGLGEIAGFIELRKCGPTPALCLNPEKIDWFCEQTGLKRKKTVLQHGTAVLQATMDAQQKQHITGTDGNTGR